MVKNLRNRLLIILAVIAGSIYCAFPIQDHINLGLDLKGGMHLVLEVETDKLDENARKDAVPRAIEIIRNRIDGLGVAEPVIQQQGENQILVQLPGVTNREQAINLIGPTAKLEFRLVSETPANLNKALNNEPVPGYELKYLKEDNSPILVEENIALDGKAVADARVDFNQNSFNTPQISLSLNSEGAKIFAKVTRENVGRRLAILLDDKVLSAPSINEAISGGSAQITGQFSFEEASLLALSLRSGSLPAPVHIEEERTIGPLLGKDSITAGVNATVIAGTLVLAFMLIYYLKAGLISCIALALNLLLIVGIMGFFNLMLPASPLTLSLPGIAGIILTLGMAVDANVLINERIREEIQNGRPILASINSGFSKALKAIVDSNTTSLIAAFMLFQFGSGPIKGFAVTLSLGLIASLFTALFVTRTLFDLFFTWGQLKSIPMLQFFSNTNINFINKRYVCFALSAVLFFGSIFLWINKKDTAYGIDFSGGQIQEYRFTTKISVDEIRNSLKASGFDDAIIQQFEQHPENIIVRTVDDTYEKISEGFKNSFPNNKFEILRIERVGPVVGKHLRRSALMAIFFALAGILIYVGFRFKHFDFATAGVVALLHDVIITIGVLLLMGRQIDLLVVTALLTIAGYSINDTIIIYDRIRENMHNKKKDGLGKVINDSINQTLGRTLLTTFTTLIVVITLYLKGGEVLNTFALCLIIGFVAGTYSTIYIASPIVLAWEKKSK